MEKIKDAIGFGSKFQEGQEPVSGEQGAGTATEPYDAGNREGMHGIPSIPMPLIGPYTDGQYQTIRPSAAKLLKRQVTSLTLISETRLVLTLRMIIDADQMTGDALTTAAPDSATSSGKSELLPSSTADNETITAETSSPKEIDKCDSDGNTEKPVVGSSGWFKTAMSIRKRKEDGLADNNEEAEAMNKTPPNHIGKNASLGHGKDTTKKDEENEPEQQSSSKPATAADAAGGNITSVFSSLNPFAPSYEKEAAKASSEVGDANEDNPARPAKIAGQKENVVPVQSVSEDLEETSEAPICPKPDKGKGKAKLMNDPPPREARGSNPSAIPLAGGKPVGSGALDRRRSVALGAIPDGSMMRDPETARNTTNTGKAEPKSGDVPNGGPRDSAAATVSPEAASSTRGGASSTASPSSIAGDGEKKAGRRRSVIDKVKGLKSMLGGSKA